MQINCPSADSLQFAMNTAKSSPYQWKFSSFTSSPHTQIGTPNQTKTQLNQMTKSDIKKKNLVPYWKTTNKYYITHHNNYELMKKRKRKEEHIFALSKTFHRIKHRIEQRQCMQINNIPFKIAAVPNQTNQRTTITKKVKSKVKWRTRKSCLIKKSERSERSSSVASTRKDEPPNTSFNITSDTAPNHSVLDKETDLNKQTKKKHF